MKTFVGILSLFLATQLQAQSEITGVAPNIDTEFSGKIETGVRSELRNNLDGGQARNVVGPYVRPGLGLDLDFPSNIKASIGYELLSFGGISGGAERNRLNNEKTGLSNGFADNTFFEHFASFSVASPIANNFSTTLGVMYFNRAYLQDTESNWDEFIFEPILSYEVTSNLSVGASYYLSRYSDVNDTQEIEMARSRDGLLLSRTPVTQTKASTSTLHAGAIRGKFNMGNFSASQYVRAGKLLKNNGNENATNVRSQTDLSLAATKALQLKGRHRFDYTNEDNSNSNSWYNRARVVANYSFASNWSAELWNEATIYDSTGGDANYKNEQYIGVIYKF